MGMTDAHTPFAPVDEDAARVLFADYLARHPKADTELTAVEQFGDSAQMADDLAALVLDGTKTATASLVAEYEDSELPRAGAFWVMCGGDGTPLAVLRTVEVRTGPIASVDERFAWDEGEGDRTRDDWYRGHSAFWLRVTGGTWTPDDDVVFERFEVVWPAG